MTSSNKKKTQRHHWRPCPEGKHWVSTHQRQTPSGGLTTVTGHCRTNRSKKDQLYSDEINEIRDRYFSKLENKLSNNKLGHKNGNLYNDSIAGWTQYWNDVLQPDEPLDPNLVKALIETESGFNPKAKNNIGKRNFAHGLMQITDQSLSILSDENGELKDHLVNLDRDDLNDPNLNICAGVRWLHRKREIASSKLGRTASWLESAEEYKSYLGKSDEKYPNKKIQMEKLKNTYETLKNSKK